jgi:hypothetical protein
VLGITFEDLGIGVGAAWHFPDRLLHSMRRVTDAKVRRPASTDEHLQMVADLAAELCACLRAPDAERRAGRIATLASRYESLGIAPPLLDAVVRNAATELARDAAMFGVSPAGSELLAGLSQACHLAEREDAAGSDAPPGAERPADTPAEPAAGAARGSAERSAILNAGIQDITNSLVGDYELNDILRMILETMYRGVGFTRVLLCVRDPSSNALKARFGFGADVDRILRQGFQVPLAPARDAFHAAISNGADIFIENVDGDRIREHIPQWYRKLVPARSLALFPLMVKGKPVGLFYGDCDQAGALGFDPPELNLLKTLRNQAVLAMRQKP